MHSFHEWIADGQHELNVGAVHSQMNEGILIYRECLCLLVLRDNRYNEWYIQLPPAVIGNNTRICEGTERQYALSFNESGRDRWWVNVAFTYQIPAFCHNFSYMIIQTLDGKFQRIEKSITKKWNFIETVSRVKYNQ